MEKVIASYHRVSPTKKDQISAEGVRLSHAEIQENMHKTLVTSVESCDRAALSNGEKIKQTYIDEYKSGKSQDNMVQFKEMINDAKNGKLSKLYIRRADRFGRNLNESFSSIVELDNLGIVVISVEDGVDTSTPIGKGILAFMIGVAENQRKTWEESRTAGIERAKAKGVKFGQPEKKINIGMLRSERLKPVSERSTWKQLEEDFNCSRTTLIKKLKENGYWDEEKRCVK